ncbi:Uncharacterised protein [Mycobacteroides abscessus subsp. abscessus]|nr:Uncharacterised protein [Mycobacteroides abscessus subsp. abscessus]
MEAGECIFLKAPECFSQACIPFDFKQLQRCSDFLPVPEPLHQHTEHQVIIRPHPDGFMCAGIFVSFFGNKVECADPDPRF